MAGSRDINGRSCLGAGVYRRRPRWGEGGTHVWEGGKEPAMIHGVLTWARTSKWRMRQAELVGKGAVWVGRDCDNPFGLSVENCQYVYL